MELLLTGIDGVSSRLRQAVLTFSPNRADAKFCSHACRQLAYRQRQHSEAAMTRIVTYAHRYSP